MGVINNWNILLAETVLWGLGTNQGMIDRKLFQKSRIRRLPQDQQSLAIAVQYNKISDEMKHSTSHTNMFAEYSYSFQVLTSKTHQSADILSYLNWTYFYVYFLEKVCLNKLSNYGGQTCYNFFHRFNCPNYLPGFGEY